MRLKAKSVVLGPSQTRTLRLALSRAARSAVRRALRERSALRAKLLVAVADAAGNSATTARTVRLTA